MVLREPGYFGDLFIIVVIIAEACGATMVAMGVMFAVRANIVGRPKGDQQGKS
jgi:hypothetical protein